jgi:protein gp37
MNLTNIDWTHRAGTIGTTWNVVTGCNKESRGCKNCYAEVMHKRLQAMGQEKYQQPFLAGPVLHPDLIQLPLSWKKPRTVFVNSMSDLFHKDVPFHFIGMVFNMMAATPQHTYIVLTKRAERMMEFTHWYYEKQKADGFDPFYGALPNVEIGVSVENQQQADKRIPFLLKAVAAVRLLSCEPLVGPVDLMQLGIEFLDWVIVGGESGHKAEPMHPDWVRKLRDDCEEWDVPFFFKQWGEYLPFEETAQPPFYKNSATGEEFDGHGMNFIDRNGDPGKFRGGRWMDGLEAMLYCEETNSHPCMFLKVGKGNSRSKLNDVMHKEFPKT